MKKNITINLFGTLYAIDEDACQLLEQYTENMKSYFSKQAGGDEIADDIEHRIAELLWENKQQGNEAVDIDTIKRIIEKIGNPEQMTDKNDNGNDNENENQEQKTSGVYGNAGTATGTKANGPRKLYRDMNDKMLGGVISGIAHYFGSKDPLAWRIGTLLLIFVGSAFYKFIMLNLIFPIGWYYVAMLALYVAAWMLIPEATTAEERLSMHGKPVNPETIKEEVFKEQARREGKAPRESEAHGCANGCLSIFVLIIKLFVFVVLGIIGIGLFCGLMAGVIAIAVSPTHLVSGSLGMSLWVGIPFLICLFTVVALPFYGLLRLFFSKTSQSTATNLTLLAIWIVALVSLFPMARYGFKEAREGVGSAFHITLNHFFDHNFVNDNSVWYNDSIITRNEPVEDFTKLKLSGVGTIEIEQCDSCYFWAEGHSNILDNTIISVVDGELSVKTNGSNRGGICTYHIGAPQIEQINFNGVGDLNSYGNLEFDKPFSLTCSSVGSANINHVKAPAVTLIYKGVGGGSCDVDCDELSVELNGVGGISVSGTTHRYNRNAKGIAAIDDDDLVIKPN